MASVAGLMAHVVGLMVCMVTTLLHSQGASVTRECSCVPVKLDVDQVWPVCQSGDRSSDKSFGGPLYLPALLT